MFNTQTQKHFLHLLTQLPRKTNLIDLKIKKVSSNLALTVLKRKQSLYKFNY